MGGDLALTFKIESHNHPSFIEPFQGAATGVGGILRDIFTMGARPIAILDSLRFGDPADPRDAPPHRGRRLRHLAGTATASACPTWAARSRFAPEYAGNPLVNVMSRRSRAHRPDLPRARRGRRQSGLLRRRQDRPRRHPRRHHGVGHLRRGRGGSAGRPCRSATRSRRSSCWRRASRRWPPAPSLGIQDMGAAGLACACSEMPARAGTGMEVELVAVPQRETGDDAVRDPALRVAGAHAAGGGARAARTRSAGVFAKWELDAVEIGAVTGDGLLRVRSDGRDRGRGAGEGPGRRGPGLREAHRAARVAGRARGASTRSTLPAPAELEPRRCSTCSPRRRIASKEWVFRQYDQQVGINTLVLPGLRRGRAAHQGHPQGRGGHHRRQRAVRSCSIRASAPPWRWRRPRATSP